MIHNPGSALHSFGSTGNGQSTESMLDMSMPEIVDALGDEQQQEKLLAEVEKLASSADVSPDTLAKIQSVAKVAMDLGAGAVKAYDSVMQRINAAENRARSSMQGGAQVQTQDDNTMLYVLGALIVFLLLKK